MASPPFNMEDQTDEDFFDKLVSDEFEITESDQAKALSNLTLGDAGPSLEDSDGDYHQSSSAITESSLVSEKDIVVGEDGGSLVSSTSFVFDRVIESNDPDKMTDLALDSNLGTSGRSKSVKEVQWSAFNTNSAQHDSGGFGSYSDFFTELGDSSIDPKLDSYTKTSFVETPVTESTASLGSSQHQDAQDLYNSQYWENMYPGWRYDPSTGEWVQLEGYDATKSSNQVGFQDKAQSSGEDVVSDHKSEAVSYLQQTAQSVVGTVTESCSTGSVSNWNGTPHESVEYPSHMVFDPNYPGWYYDTITQEWRLLETYTHDVQTASVPQNQQTQVENASFDGLISRNDHNLYGGQFENYNSQGQGVQGQDVTSFNNNQQIGNIYGLTGHVETVPSYGQANQGYVSTNGAAGFQFNYNHGVPSENLYQFNQPNVENNQQANFSHNYYNQQKPVNYSQQAFQTGDASRTQFSYASSEGRSSAGRPPHALVTFGFGGKLVIMKDVNSFSTNSVYRSQEPLGGLVSILNLVEVVMGKTGAASTGSSVCDYFRTLCQQSFPGPLVGGNVASKELNKWIDERIANCELSNADLRKGELQRLLFSLLKISCQHYGKLRSPFGVDSTLQETGSPESAVTKLFASARRNGAQLSEYGALAHCMQNLPSEGQIRATAVEVQNLLVSGRRIEALQCAQEGQLWGPAVVLAAQLGEKFYADTVKQMAHRQFVAGSPLRTLCLLIAGQPADVFSADSSITSGPFGTVNISQQQVRSGSMLDDWEENLAVITANRTKDDELVIIHLGDCLWKERGEVTAAHTCYLVAEANFESYSDSARMCLIGADHWKCPRTYASPQAIQRTELYEYSKVLGNSQFILLPFQPYKLIYAYMLAEVGKVSESLRYCQAILKLLKNSGRAPEMEIWKVLLSSLEDRIRMHQQGGYSTNLAPAKLVGKLFTSIDRSLHRMIGAPPPPVASLSQSNFQTGEHVNHSVVPKVVNSQSTMAMSSLVPSASMEPISGWTGDSDRMTMHNRSISEPDFGRSPIQEGSSTETQGKSSIAGRPSRFGRIGSQFLQKTMGWVSRSRPDRQAKLGDKNKFYYDEKLKRWVEEGAEPPAEEAALPPPPTTTSFQNGGMSDYNINGGFKNQTLPPIGGSETKSSNPAEQSSGIPPIPSSMNQFSARGRMGVRSRYVDTFNKGGGTPTNLFQSPSIPAPKPGGGAKFFIPTPANSSNQTVDPSVENVPEATTNEDHSTSAMKDPSIPIPPSVPSSSMPRFSSMDNLAPMASKGPGSLRNGNGSLSSRSVSWSGSGSDTFNPTMAEIRSLGANSCLPGDPASMRLPMNGGSFGDDLHEVEL